jgi:3-methyl-2-oxobutanoate hydroxymethyltransferase
MNEPRKKVTIRTLQQMKAEGKRIAALGVYDSPMAAIADEIGFEILMIGNSGPMSLLGYRNSTTIPREDLLYMTRAVSRVTKYALVIATMPYMSYLVSKEEGIRTAAWLVSEGGAECVQCHADQGSADNVEAIVRAGVPVLAHLGLQSVRKVEQSGFSVQGKTAAQAAEIVADALALADAGVFAVLLELVPAEITQYLRQLLTIPILSLGSGPDADGIYQVSADVVGFSVFPRPQTAAQFVDAQSEVEIGLKKFFTEVGSKAFPSKTVQRCMPKHEYNRLKKMLHAKRRLRKS